MTNKNIQLVLIHGFAANKNIWGNFAEQLAQNYTVHQWDLPGYGAYANVDKKDLNAITHFLLAKIEQPVIWLGWSLGGQIASYLAHVAPQMTQGLITLAYNPKFIASEDWPCGVRYGAFHNLEQVLIREREKALQRFLKLQNNGLTSEQIKHLAHLQQQVSLPTTEVLLRDLNLLATMDMRDTVKQLTCPQLTILGGQDRVVPIELAQHLNSLSTKAQNVTIESAGHVMFLSHMTECLTTINRFIHESITTE